MNGKVRAIIADVADRHGLRPDQITGPLQLKPIALARAEAAYRIRTELRPAASNPNVYSYPNIGRMLNRHPASVHAAVNRYADLIASQ